MPFPESNKQNLLLSQRKELWVSFFAQRLISSCSKMVLLILSVFNMSALCAQGFHVEEYHVDITIHKEGYFDVVENYDLVFDIAKHGIFRDIQTKYDLRTAKGGLEKRQIEINHIEVPGYTYDVSSAFSQRVEGEVSIKIGDADVTLSGPQHYEIKYRVVNAFLHEDSVIHFYWNIKPGGWIAPFHKINFAVHLPENVSVAASECFVYAGPFGAENPSNEFDTDYSNGTFYAKSHEDVLSPGGESVTVLIKLPPGSVKTYEPFWPFWTDYGWTLILTLLLAIFYGLWRKFGKDDHVPTTTSYYAPEKMDPAMAGFLINDKEDTSDLISLIPYWATNGLLKIEEIAKEGWFSKSDTKLTMLKSIDNDAPVYQRTIFNGLFDGGVGETVLISSLKNTFYTKMGTAKAKLKSEAQEYYLAGSKRVQIITAVILVLVLIILFPLNLMFWGVVAAITGVLFCIVLLIINQYMVKKNKRGNEVFSELKGFRKFIKIAEEKKLKMLLKEDPGYFESTMSYALAFGLFDKWAEKFDGLDVQPPSWYSSYFGKCFYDEQFLAFVLQEYLIGAIYHGQFTFFEWFIRGWWFFGWRIWRRWRWELVSFQLAIC